MVSMIGLISQDFSGVATLAMAPRESLDAPENLPEEPPCQALSAEACI
jgi:hypothetical protein